MVRIKALVVMCVRAWLCVCVAARGCIAVCGCVCCAWVAVRVAVCAWLCVCGCVCVAVYGSVAVWWCAAHQRCCNNICTWQANIQIASQYHSQRRVTRLLLHHSCSHSFGKAKNFLQLLLLDFNGSASERSLHVCVQDQQSLSG